MSERDERSGDTRTERLSEQPNDVPAAPFMIVVSCAAGPFVQAIPARERLVLGRGKDCDVVVDDPSVSRHHAALRTLGTLEVRDLDSTNGTKVDGRRLGPGVATAVDPGHPIELGTALVLVQRGASEAAMAPQPRPPARAAGDDAPIVHDARMKRLYATLDVVAPTPLAVLVLGETGVGKEVFAEAIHRASHRAGGPFVALNCAALPDGVLEGELFGYEKGAFTGAVQARAGLFEAAHGGTVFLDEIGELPAATQAKLLRVLERGEVLRLGARKPLAVDFRVVAATNRDLKAMVAAGQFRADLFFRLNGVAIALPALRERPDDVAPLARVFLSRARARLGRPPATLAPEAERALVAYAWPGNVRELRNVIDRVAALAPGATIDARALQGAEPDLFAAPPPASRASAPPPPPSTGGLKDEMRTLEKQRILDALAETHGNQKRAAEVLGISRRALLNKLDLHGIAGPRKPRG